MFRIGYNTNGFACHPVTAAIDILAEQGYRSVAITIDHYALDPGNANLDSQIESIRRRLKHWSFTSVIETGARFLLNPRKKHEPTLVSQSAQGRKHRINFLKNALDIAVALQSDALSFWSGRKAEVVDKNIAWKWLIEGCKELAEYAELTGIPLGFEPEPGMFVENMDQYRYLKNQVDSDMFKLTLDLGHAFITEDVEVHECIELYRNDIVNIHLEDMKKNEHKHLFFGEGEMDFNKIFQALIHSGYDGPVNVELSRHSHNAVITARDSMLFLIRQFKPALDSAGIK